jgi:hypothetical protein
MVALGEVGERTIITPNCGVKVIQLVTGAVDTGDTIDVTLTNYGARNIHGILGFECSGGAGSVVTAEQPTTAVTTGVLTITVGGTANDGEIRQYVIFAY